MGVAAVATGSKLSWTERQRGERVRGRQGVAGDAGHAAVEAVEVRVARAVAALGRIEVTVDVTRWVAQDASLGVCTRTSVESVDAVTVLSTF